MKYKTISYRDGVLELLDQRELPEKIIFFLAVNHREVVAAIRDMVVRGAPAIGATAAWGVCLAAREYVREQNFSDAMEQACNELAGSRPTAVNLMWAIQRQKLVLSANSHLSAEAVVAALEAEAEAITREDVLTNKRMAGYGNDLVPSRATILTHCNTGSLATVGWGTALGVIREAHQSGKQIHVYADETRPRLQGANLTAFELIEAGIPATLIVDSVAATLLRDGKIDLVLVGADRIAANGDTANKIGTYMLSELAARFQIPFYVVAPVSTIDFQVFSGSEITIEERSSEEVTHIRGIRVAPQGIKVYNPAFDITPAANITGIVTEAGVLLPPFTTSIAEVREES